MPFASRRQRNAMYAAAYGPDDVSEIGIKKSDALKFIEHSTQGQTKTKRADGDGKRGKKK